MQPREKSRKGPTICGHPYSKYLEIVENFHGYVAPGMVLGGFMVDLACRHLPGGEHYDALCETRACLPDAIQVLTPCTVGNGWLRILNLGRFALILYQKHSGTGVRVFVDPQKMDLFPELRSWFLKLKPKKEINDNQLLVEIREAGFSVCGLEEVKMDLGLIRREHRERFSICPSCHESYPSEHGPLCRGCQRELPYRSCAGDVAASKGPTLKAISVERAVTLPSIIEEM